MDDPDDDSTDRRHTVNQEGNPLLLDGGVGSEVDFPDHQTAEEKHRHQQRHRPEHELLAGIEARHFRNALFLIDDHAGDGLGPGQIVPAPHLVAPELDDEAAVAQHQRRADPGVNGAGPLAAAEQSRQKEQHRVKHRQP